MLALQLEYEAAAAEPLDAAMLAARRAHRSTVEAAMDDSSRRLIKQHASAWGLARRCVV
jgi:hypothetical protein